MDTNLTELSSLFVYSYGYTRCIEDLVYCKSYEKVYLRFVKASDYKTNGENKHSMNFLLYTVPAVKSLIKILPVALNEAKRFKGVRLFLITVIFLRNFI